MRENANPVSLVSWVFNPLNETRSILFNLFNILSFKLFPLPMGKVQKHTRGVWTRTFPPKSAFNPTHNISSPAVAEGDSTDCHPQLKK
jgi:hypothetical protein